MDAHTLTNRVNTVESRLRANNVMINETKSEYAKSQIRVLGTVIGDGKCWPDHNKIEILLDFTRPTCVSDVRFFLGMIQFNDKYIKNLSSVKEPLTRLLSKQQDFL